MGHDRNFVRNIDNQGATQLPGIPDPGTAGDISTDRSGVCVLNTAGVDNAITILPPKFPGQRIAIYNNVAAQKTITVTGTQGVSASTPGFDQAGHLTIVMALIAACAIIYSVRVNPTTGALAWRIILANGATAT